MGLTISTRLVKNDGGQDLGGERARQGELLPFHGLFWRRALSRNSPAPTARLVGTPVLVVDDNSTNRRILTELLWRWKMRPAPRRAAMEALDVAAGS